MAPSCQPGNRLPSRVSRSNWAYAAVAQLTIRLWATRPMNMQFVRLKRTGEVFKGEHGDSKTLAGNVRQLSTRASARTERMGCPVDLLQPRWQCDLTRLTSICCLLQTSFLSTHYISYKQH